MVTGRSALRRRRFALDCSAIQGDGGRGKEEEKVGWRRKRKISEVGGEERGGIGEEKEVKMEKEKGGGE